MPAVYHPACWCTATNFKQLPVNCRAVFAGIKGYQLQTGKGGVELQPQNSLIWWEEKPVDDKEYQKLRVKLFYAKRTGSPTVAR